MADVTIDFESDVTLKPIIARLTVTDGELYSPPLSTIQGVIVGDNRTTGFPVGSAGTAVTASFKGGGTPITFHGDSVPDVAVPVSVWGTV